MNSNSAKKSSRIEQRVLSWVDEVTKASYFTRADNNKKTEKNT